MVEEFMVEKSWMKCPRLKLIWAWRWKVQGWNVLQPIESNTDNVKEKLKGIQVEIEIQKSRQILTNKTIESQKMEITKTQELLEDKSATITAKLEGMYSKF